MLTIKATINYHWALDNGRPRLFSTPDIISLTLAQMSQWTTPSKYTSHIPLSLSGLFSIPKMNEFVESEWLHFTNIKKSFQFCDWDKRIAKKPRPGTTNITAWHTPPQGVYLGPHNPVDWVFPMSSRRYTTSSFSCVFMHMFLALKPEPTHSAATGKGRPRVRGGHSHTSHWGIRQGET